MLVSCKQIISNVLDCVKIKHISVNILKAKCEGERCKVAWVICEIRNINQIKSLQKKSKKNMEWNKIVAIPVRKQHTCKYLYIHLKACVCLYAIPYL